jgi:hypothetical protein
MKEDTLGLVEELDLFGDVVFHKRALSHLFEFGFRKVDSLQAEEKQKRER